ncbi:MAG: dienelactone hydrolase family protein [Thermodesulfobacteriota bacterium]
MKWYPDDSFKLGYLVIFFGLAIISDYLALAEKDEPHPIEPKQEVFTPTNEKGPIVILISGSSGFSQDYRRYAVEVAQLGYYTVLLNGKDFRTPIEGDNEAAGHRDLAQKMDLLRDLIKKSQLSPKVLPGKVAVIGFSMGGGGALSYAAAMPDLVSAVIVYYPMTRDILDMQRFAANFQVPILVFAGGLDNYMNSLLSQRY